LRTLRPPSSPSAYGSRGSSSVSADWVGMCASREPPETGNEQSPTILLVAARLKSRVRLRAVALRGVARPWAACYGWPPRRRAVPLQRVVPSADAPVPRVRRRQPARSRPGARVKRTLECSSQKPLLKVSRRWPPRSTKASRRSSSASSAT
jgi:hypothetical protein